MSPKLYNPISTTILMKRVLYFALLGVLAVSCQNDDDSTQDPTPNPSALTRTYSGEFLNDYFTLQCDITKDTPGFLPTIAARAYGYLGIAAYESVVHGISGAQSLAGQVDGMPAGSLPIPIADQKYNWAVACNASSAQIMRYMFGSNISPENLTAIDDLEAVNLENLSDGVPAEVLNRSINFGVAIADAVYDVSTTDGGHESYLNPFQLPYEIPVADYCWIPTGAALQPLSPYWGSNRSMVSGTMEQNQPGPHIPFSTDPESEFYEAANVVYNQVMTVNTQEEVTITEYWADDPFQTCTPAGHSFNIVNQLLRETGASLEKTAVGLAMMGLAENDAFIACWKAKYDHMLIRPVSYIKLYIDPNFNTVIGTPPFPAYTSGHATECGAGAKIVSHLFANANGDYEFTDLSQLQYGFSARTYDNFYTMAEECAASRFYGGIHYTFDNDLGLEMGYGIGDAIIENINWPTNIQ